MAVSYIQNVYIVSGPVLIEVPNFKNVQLYHLRDFLEQDELVEQIKMGTERKLYRISMELDWDTTLSLEYLRSD